MTKRSTDAGETTLIERFRVVVDAAGKRPEAARIAGVSTRQLQLYLSGTNEPSLDVVAKLASHGGFDLNWLIHGQGTPKGAARSIDAASLDPELLGRIVDALGSVYREEKVALPELDLGRIAAEEYDAIAAATEDATERLTMVKLVSEKHRRALRTEKPEARKRGA